MHGVTISYKQITKQNHKMGGQAIELARKYIKSHADFYKLVRSTASSPKSSLLEQTIVNFTGVITFN
jgi:imidazole glycerol phosphate synthase subunit HisF